MVRGHKVISGKSLLWQVGFVLRFFQVTGGWRIFGVVVGWLSQAIRSFQVLVWWLGGGHRP